MGNFHKVSTALTNHMAHKKTYHVFDKHTNELIGAFNDKQDAKARRNQLQSETKNGLPVPVFDNDGNVVSDPRPVASNWRYKVVTL